MYKGKKYFIHSKYTQERLRKSFNKKNQNNQITKSTFNRLWETYYKSQIHILNKKSEYCKACLFYTFAITKTKNKDEKEKLVKEFEQHYQIDKLEEKNIIFVQNNYHMIYQLWF